MKSYGEILQIINKQPLRQLFEGEEKNEKILGNFHETIPLKKLSFLFLSFSLLLTDTVIHTYSPCCPRLTATYQSLTYLKSLAVLCPLWQAAHHVDDLTQLVLQKFLP
jgi:hypothetical protein